MYPHTVEGLFEAVAKGTLADVEEVIKSDKVVVNLLHNNKHIITDLLMSDYPQRKEKIDFLVKSGARLQFDDKCNTLMHTSNLKKLELQKTLVTLIKETESFKNKYTQYHFAALEGVAPKTAEEAFAKDYYGLYPIYYAIKNSTANESWFENIEYDFFTPIENGLYEGINLVWWLLDSQHIKLKLEQLLTHISADKSFELLMMAPLNPDNINYGKTVAFELFDLDEERYEDFTRLTQGLTVEQRYEILKSASLNPNNINYGVTVAFKLLDSDEERYEDFTRLTQDLTGEQRYEILKLALLNSNHPHQGMTVAWLLLHVRRYGDFTRLTQDLTGEQRYELSKSAPLNPEGEFHGITVAWLLLAHRQYEDFARLMDGLTSEQRYELLKSAPLHPHDKARGVTLAWLLINYQRYQDFKSITENLTAEQYYEILKSAPLNPDYEFHGITLLMMLLEQKRYKDVSKLMQKLSVQQRNELLKLKPQNAQNTLYIMLLVGLLEAKRDAEFEMMIQGLNIDQLIELLLEPNINNQQKIKNVYLLQYLAKENESLLIKILEPYEINDSLLNLYEKIEKSNQEFFTICFVLLEKINIELRKRMQFLQGKCDQEKSDMEKELDNQSIIECLKVLLDIYDQLAVNEKYGKKASEIVGMTISEACQLWCRDIFVEYFDSINNADYAYIKSIESNHALDSYGHYLKVLGCENRNLARQLGVEYGQSKSGKYKSEINKEPAKPVDLEMKSAEGDNSQDMNSLKRKIIELEEENKKLKTEIQQQTSSPEHENIKSKSTGGDPRLFATRTRGSNSYLAPKRKRDEDINDQVPKPAKVSDELIANIR